MNRFYFVAPRTSNEEVVECAIKLLQHDYEQRPNEDKSHHHLFIDAKRKHFFFTDELGMSLLLETAPAAFDAPEVTETNLQEIIQWEQRKPRPRIKA